MMITQNVLITGAATRIGRAIALAMAKAGWNVAVHHHRSSEEAKELVSELQSLGATATAISANLLDSRQAEGVIDSAHERLGAISCLINNAALFEYDNIHTVTSESWKAHLSVNLTSPLLLSQTFANQVPDGKVGNIINIIDQRVWNLTPHFISYTISKTGLWTLTQTLALALAPNIRVNGVGPGPTLPSSRQTEGEFRAQWQALPLQRKVSPEEISEAVAYILSAQSMTGQMIALDGGQHLGWSPSDSTMIAKE